MNKKLKNYTYNKIISFLLVIIIIFTLCACANNDTKVTSENEVVVIGFSQPGAESAWRLRNTQSVQEAADEAGYKLEFIDSQHKQENQIKALRTFIAYQVDVIAFSAIVESGWDNVLKEAKDAGIPVILTDRTIDTTDESLYLCTIGSDFYQEGIKAGNWLYDQFRTSPRDVNIIELLGTVDSSPTKGRSTGFRDGLRCDDKFKIVHSESGDFFRSRGLEMISDYIKNGVPVTNNSLKEGRSYDLDRESNSSASSSDSNSSPQSSQPIAMMPFNDIDVIYSHNDSMTLGVIEGLEKYGYKPGEDLLIITIDAQQEAIELLKENKINCVIECSPELGPKLIETVKMIIDGRTDEIPKTMYTEETIFTQNDDLDSLPKRLY